MDGLVYSREALTEAMSEAHKIVGESAIKVHGETGSIPDAIRITLEGYEKCLKTLLYIEVE